MLVVVSSLDGEVMVVDWEMTVLVRGEETLGMFLLSRFLDLEAEGDVDGFRLVRSSRSDSLVSISSRSRFLDCFVGRLV